MMNPDQVYKFTIDLWATSNVFRKGHILRLEISSSNFPRFDTNLNTGEDARLAQRSVAATNTVFHDAQHPSALVLAVVPRTSKHHFKGKLSHRYAEHHGEIFSEICFLQYPCGSV